MSGIDAFDQILRDTLADLRLSRSEDRALRAVIDEIGPDPHQHGLLMSRVFAIAEETIEGEQNRQVLRWLKRVAAAFEAAKTPESAEAAEAYFGPDIRLVERLVELLHQTRQSADICVFTVTDDRISRAIAAAHDRGIRVRVLSDDDKSGDLGSDIERLTEHGVPVALDNSPAHMHHKFALFDNRYLVNGSYNWTRSAAHSNLENFVISDDKRLLNAFGDEFERLWKQFYRG